MISRVLSFFSLGFFGSLYFGLFFGVVSPAQTSFASANALAPFVAEMKLSGFPVQMIAGGAEALTAVKFVDASRLSYASAMFVPALREIMLSRTLADGTGSVLQPLDQLGADDIGVIVHELWHSYYHSHPQLRNQVLAGVDTLYAEAPPSKREEIQDEAFGLFIQKTVAANLGLRRIAARSAPDVWARLRTNPVLVFSYEKIFTEPDYGYYQAGTFLNRSLQWSHTPLPAAFKNFILQILLENKISGSFEKDFPLKI